MARRLPVGRVDCWNWTEPLAMLANNHVVRCHVWPEIPRLSWRTLTFAFIIGCYTTPHAFALTASPAALSFQAVQGGSNPASQSITVSKSNKKTTNWTASNSATWVSVSPNAGSILTAAQITVSVNTAGLAAGTYSATVAVTAYQGGSVSIPVSVTLTPATTTSSSTSTPTTSTSTPTTSTTALLNWSPPSTGTVSGYNVYVGTASGVYGAPINVGNVTSYTVPNLGIGSTYYFVVTDYNSSGVESLPSNEVSKVIY